MFLASSQYKTYTPEDYLKLEVESDIRSEYRNGEIRPMTGGTPEHNKLASALNALLWFGLRGKCYSVFITDQRLWIEYSGLDVQVSLSSISIKLSFKDLYDGVIPR